AARRETLKTEREHCLMPLSKRLLTRTNCFPSASHCWIFLALLFFRCGPKAPAQSAPQYRQADRPALLLGAAWYPEQWPESRWDTDLELMQKAHLHVVATAENGTRYQGAVRNRFNWNSDRYRELVRDIDERLAQRFGHNPNV